jgi:hypothetical protein
MQRSLMLECQRRCPDAKTSPVKGYDNPRMAYFCEVGPNTAHHRCQTTWCKCACHDHEEFSMPGMW